MGPNPAWLVVLELEMVLATTPVRPTRVWNSSCQHLHWLTRCLQEAEAVELVLAEGHGVRLLQHVMRLSPKLLSLSSFGAGFANSMYRPTHAALWSIGLQMIYAS
ncbi:hypothetical protein BKA62DRAFT_716845 [Auriculariales sp. MPI-PUGE-AT-0066]|nr:hypothetical protein BKA62DRAFT_716845 [Auriculariales sp. MPI-PUGE-AT-0066]